MENQPKPKRGPLKLDHKEMVVLFTLFAFSALLMFTLGIVVGKGITQAKYNGQLPENKLNYSDERAEKKHEAVPKSEQASTTYANDTPAKPLELEPKYEKEASLSGGSLKEPSGRHETEALLENPNVTALIDQSDSQSKKEPEKKIRTIKIDAGNDDSYSQAKLTESIYEQTQPTPKRKVSSMAPETFPSGKFTVQIGSYASEEEAKSRVKQLKNLGFEYAYFSAKNVGDRTWYRVWSGYTQDYASAKKSGEYLQKKNEVVSYLVRESTTE